MLHVSPGAGRGVWKSKRVVLEAVPVSDLRPVCVYGLVLRILEEVRVLSFTQGKQLEFQKWRVTVSHYSYAQIACRLTDILRRLQGPSMLD